MSFIEQDDLKFWLHQNIDGPDKLLTVLATFSKPTSVKEVGAAALRAGFKIPKTWNVSTMFSRTKGLSIRTPDGWELTQSGKQRLANLGIGKVASTAVHAASDLRAELPNIKDASTRAFVEEAIKCLEGELHRSAIVMSWIAAVDVLYNIVIAKHLSAFNAEAVRVDSKWRPATTADDLAKMKEGDFLDRLASISVIGKNVKTELKGCLDRRNGCGHPNSLKIGANTTAHHIEILLLNVFRAL
jgi:hypothetical protein